MFSAYKDIYKYIYDNKLAWVYKPEAIYLSLVNWIQAFQDSMLKYLNMDQQSFMKHCGLWRSVNVDVDKDADPDDDCFVNPYLKMPPSDLARSGPLVTFKWNSSKKRGETMTRCGVAGCDTFWGASYAHY